MNQYLRRNGYRLALSLIAVALTLFAVDNSHGQPIFMVGGIVGGMATDTTEMENAMKVLFEDSLEVNVVTESEMLDLFEKDMNVQSETTGGGRYIETAQLFGLPAGYGYRTESDAIPVPRGPQIENGRIYLKKSMGSVSITGDVFEKVKQGKEAFTTWATQQIPLLGKRMANTKDQIMIGYGVGIRARVATIGADYITVDRAFGITGMTNAILQFLQNEDVSFSNTAAGTALRANAAAGNNFHVENVDFKNGRVYLSEVTNIVANDYIFGADEHGSSNQTAAGVNREFMGLFGHVDDGDILLDYFNIARDEHSAWQATNVDISGAPYNGVFNDEAILYGDMQGRLYGGAEIDVIAAPYTGALAFWKDLKNDRQLNDPRSWTGGHGKLFTRIRDRIVEVRGVRKLPPEVAFGLTKGTFKRYTLGKFQWSSRTGSMWQQVISNGRRYDAFWAYGTDYDEIFCKEPNKNIRWDGLSSS